MKRSIQGYLGVSEPPRRQGRQGREGTRRKDTPCPMPNAQCPMPNE
ncbi:hypothetical protein H6G33_13425 [Calothrix sp. FACHB-1219]|nr:MULTISPECIES: hypothetical protein [unclassified Calothrix]MBD2204816.1 hypothetical protein [Calothrix sp. FACHB-168]MBD2218036.1 hypothetical protein [Calothrix sp. FACHB-1219]